MTEIMPVPRKLILLSYQQGAFILTFLYIKSFFAVAAVLAALRAAGAFAAAAAPALFHAAHGKHEPHGKNGDYNKLHFKKSPR